MIKIRVFTLIFVLLVLSLALISGDQAVCSEHEMISGETVKSEAGRDVRQKHDGSLRKSERYSELEPESVILAEKKTMTLLRTNWLKEIGGEEYSSERAGLSSTFWIILIVPVILSILITLLFSSKTRHLSIRLRLYISYGTLVLISVILGIIGYYYLNKVNDFSHLETAFANLDMLSGEIHFTQNEFLLHGLENHVYGEKVAEKHEKLLKTFREDLKTIRDSRHLEAEQYRFLDEIEEDIGIYKKDLRELIAAFHEIEDAKEKLDRLGEAVDRALEKMILHHESDMKKSESRAYHERMLEYLFGSEILAVRLFHDEAEFLLDKSPERVEGMSVKAGLLMAYLERINEELRDLREKKRLEKVEDKMKSYIALLKNVIRDEAVIEKSTAEMTEMLYRIKAACIRLSKNAEAKADGMVREADIASILMVIIALIMGIFLSVFITGKITGPLDDAVRISDELGQGNMVVEIKTETRDEIGKLLFAMKNMADKLRGVVKDVKSGAENIASAASQLASVSQQINSSSQIVSQGASEQASSVEQASASMEEMTASIRQNADNAQHTEKIAMKSAEDGRESGETVIETVKAMKEIAQKVSIIEEIARQTNLLALNAAVEAARAGVEGKGFAVVASEIRKLAVRSQRAAAEINALSASSVETAERAGEMLNKLVPDIRKTTELVQEISASSKEQSSGSDQINQAIQQLNYVIQQNATASEEASGTAEEMSSMAEELAAQSAQLQRTISFFRTEKDDDKIFVKESLPEARLRAPGKLNAEKKQKTDNNDIEISETGDSGILKNILDEKEEAEFEKY
ncbi:methyl-accepting chemotaxis protein [Desulfococcaceae bacterium HSG8]|nr:methyl-accepting chemotaxis protein [Desulfococcaceae bacterium HSG8]